ncbi:MAG: vWA domain-containing protein [Candidatus Jordarchaeum sp.]|uniref:vWA domain-containing protein n=1 Tax=Candidatus Jordarchaeum sp. TaxID=2823881 RepID=UPI00404AAF1F
MTTEEKITRIKMWFTVYEPFYGQLLVISVRKDNDNCPTLGVNNRGELIYNEEFIETLTDKEKLFAFAHEILHLAYLHPFRCGNRDPYIWNVAADLKVNTDLLVRAKPIGTPIKEGIIPSISYGSSSFEILGKTIDSIEKKTTEQIYDEIMTICKGNASKLKLKIMPDLFAANDAKGFETNAKENEIRAKVFEAMCNNKGRGDIPAGLEEEFKAMMAPKIKWDFIIKHRLNTMLKEKTWKIPNKKYLPYYFPGKRKHKTAKIVFAIDTSGSMSDDEINEALSEIIGYANTFKTHEFYIIPCDCEEYPPIKVRGTDKDKLRKGIELKGRGGTSFKPVFNQIKKVFNNDIDFLVYFTDLECEFPKEKPPYQIYWVSRNQVDVPYGRLISL